ncbi:hypothetical protein [Cohaesibacter celericrescens]|nr:hypothetical protein [Cohaesibacter celericrescens]
MRHLWIRSLFAFLACAVFSGCQSISSGLGTVIPTGKSIQGEVQWAFAALDGDIITLNFSDASGVIVAQELLPAPGAKHLPFNLVAAKNDLTRCQSGGSCRYSATLMRGEVLKARGHIYYTPTSTPVVVLSETGRSPDASAAMPKPVYQ